MSPGMQRRGYAELPLHHGRVPAWLGTRMATLGRAITEAIVWEYGRREFLVRLSDPYWFQAFGCVLGMDWHSSGITTSVLGALKRGLAPVAHELGLHVCGGRGRHSRRTPDELLALGERTGLDGAALVRCSKLTAKVDNTAIQDGFQLYLHGFVVSTDGEWAVVQQGMNPAARLARRYHWLSTALPSFVEEPHAAVVGQNQGLILNLTHREASPTRTALVEMAHTHPNQIAIESRRAIMARHHDVRAADVDLKRLAAVLVTAHDAQVRDFADLLLCPGLGPRALQALTFVSEIIYGTPSRFEDPARFSMAHGGKDGHPFPVPIKIYDTSIRTLKDAVSKAKLGHSDKLQAIRCLDRWARRAEANDPTVDFARYLKHEHAIAPQHGGRSVSAPRRTEQLELLSGESFFAGDTAGG